jgi:hypothetical protein
MLYLDASPGRVNIFFKREDKEKELLILALTRFHTGKKFKDYKRGRLFSPLVFLLNIQYS